MREFWVASGHHLTHRADHGGLVATPELIMAYLARPELMPPADACEAERNLHASLLADPLRPVSGADIAALVDADRVGHAARIALKRTAPRERDGRVTDRTQHVERDHAFGERRLFVA